MLLLIFFVFTHFNWICQK